MTKIKQKTTEKFGIVRICSSTALKTGVFLSG
jgi:hypothetical protein